MIHPLIFYWAAMPKLLPAAQSYFYRHKQIKIVRHLCDLPCAELP